MFSITKVKLHGMQDERWTTKDKLYQYRGLINLYNRDKKIMQYDKTNTARKRVKNLKCLHKQIATNRQNLENAIYGDRQKIRNTLAVDRSMQLAYQHLHSTKIVDQIYQENFNKRKELDRIFYKQKKNTRRLIHLNLELAELQDRLTYEGPGKIQVEIDVGTITGRVQDAILKKEAAITVQQTYINIINIMKKDQIYYDAVLNSLKQECMSQGTCLLHTTQIGQLATEHLDNWRYEYQYAETQVRFNMGERIKHLDQVNEQVEHMMKNVKNLTRRDSDVTVIKHHIVNTSSENQLQQEIDSSTELLEKLRSVTVVTTFDAIYPCMVAQRKQNERLGQLFERNIQNRDRLLNKENHARLMLDQITHTMVDTTMEYKQEKSDLLKKIREQWDRQQILVDMIGLRGALMVNIRGSLHQLYTITTPVTVGNVNRQGRNAKFETDLIKLIENLATRLYVLAEVPIIKLDNKSMEEAEELFKKLAQRNNRGPTEQIELDSNELLDGLVFEDVQIPTRDFIKKKSKELVDHMKLERIEPSTAIATEKSLKAYKKCKKRAVKG